MRGEVIRLIRGDLDESYFCQRFGIPVYVLLSWEGNTIKPSALTVKTLWRMAKRRGVEKSAREYQAILESGSL